MSSPSFGSTTATNYNTSNPGFTAFLSTGLTVTQNSLGATTVSGGSLQLSFPYNPDQLSWNYTLNKQSFDTYGGRVTQILSVKIETMTVQANAGSRANLMYMFNILKQMQSTQIQTKTPLLFTVPSSKSELSQTMLGTGISLYVWFKSINIGWDPKTVVYPFNIEFEVYDSNYTGYDSSGYATVSKGITNGVLQSLFANGGVANTGGTAPVGIGYNSYYAGMPAAPGQSVNNFTTLSGFEGNNITHDQLLQVTGLGQGPATTTN